MLQLIEGFDDLGLSEPWTGSFTQGEPRYVAKRPDGTVLPSGSATLRVAGDYLSWGYFTGGVILAGFAMKLTGVPYQNSYVPFLRFQEANLSLDYNGHLVANGYHENTTTWTETSTQMISSNTWYYIEARYYKHATAGTFEVRVNDTVWITHAGPTSSDGNAVGPQMIELRYPFTNTYLYGTSMSVDDLYVLDDTGPVNNSFLGDVRVGTVRPVSDVGSEMWVGSDIDSVDNYAMVNTFDPNDTTFVAAKLVDDHELYNMDRLASANATVFGIQSHVSAMLDHQYNVGYTDLYLDTFADGANFSQLVTTEFNMTAPRRRALPIQETDPVGLPWTLSVLGLLAQGPHVKPSS